MEIAQDPESEKSLLALMIETDGRLLDDVPLVDEHFVFPPHAILFPILKEIMESGIKMEFHIINSLLEVRDKLVLVGGYNLVTQIQSHGGIWTNRHHYFDRVNECLGRRRLLKIGQIAQSASGMHGENVDQTVSDLTLKLATINPSSSGKDVLESTCNEAIELVDSVASGKKATGIPTGIEAWDDAFGGLERAKLYVIGARMGVGKTAMAEQMAAHILASGEPVCFFSCDMDPRELVLRMACRDAQVSLRDLKRGKCCQEALKDVRANIETLKRVKFRLHNISHLDGEKLFSVCRTEQRKFGCNIFFLDHIQLIHAKPKEDRRTAINNAVSLITMLSHTYGASFVTLAHLNRNAAEEQAKAHHIKETDDLHGACDGMALLSTDKKNEDVTPGEPREIDMLIGKNRGGPEGKTYLLDFNRELMSFSRRK